MCPGTLQDAQEKLLSLNALWCVTHAGKLHVTSQNPGASVSSRLRLQFCSSAGVK